MAKLPPIANSPYNRHKNGFFGELGEGANAHIRFLQSAVSPNELDSITLIETIPGSETWDVKDLFQRDVDTERVTRDILPYLKNPKLVKFFNPLTLMLLPLAEGGEAVDQRLPYVAPVEVSEDGHDFIVYERPGYFRFRKHKITPAYSRVGWNDQSVRLVAIDGQHRLSALKRWKDEPPASSGELANWHIPVVILGIFRASEDESAAGLLEIVRKTFVYINSEAQHIEDARKILLDDESVNAVCTQEVVQTAHSNDGLPIEERDSARVPLIFFDWRGETRHGQRVYGPAAVKTIEELHDWFGWYLLGDDGSDSQSTALGIDDLVPPLESYGETRKLTHQDAARVRKQFCDTLEPGLLYVLENFRPYRQYIDACREIERRAYEESDLAEHAFHRIRFGRSRESDDLYKHVTAKYDLLVESFSDLKQRLLDELLVRDIGMRGVMSAFGEGKYYFDEDREYTCSWIDYAKWFTSALNSVQQDGWFSSYDEQPDYRRVLLTHIVFDPSGAIINYKHQKQHAALGALMLPMVFWHGREELEMETVETVWEGAASQLQGSLRSGFRKQYRAELKNTFAGTQTQFNAEVLRKTSQAVDTRVDNLREFIFEEDD